MVRGLYASDEDARLRLAFARLPKNARHGTTFSERRGGVLPEWVMQVIAHPYDEDDEASAVALKIEQAEVVPKPSVDAILARYRVNPLQSPAAHEASDCPG